jgi:hypothetical protein
MFLEILYHLPKQHEAILPLLVVAGALAAWSAYNKWHTGQQQGKLADKLGQTPRPARTTSPYLLENRNIAGNMVGSEMPGSGFLRGRLDRVIGSSANNAVNAGYGSPDILASLSANNSQLLDKEAELGYKGAQYREGGQKLLMQTNSVLGDEQQKNWEFNSRDKYEEAQAAASALRNASILNKQNAYDSASKIPLLYAGGGAGGAAGGMAGASGQRESQPIETGQPSSLPRTDGGYNNNNSWRTAGTDSQAQLDQYNNYKQQNPTSNVSFSQWKSLVGQFN